MLSRLYIYSNTSDYENLNYAQETSKAVDRFIILQIKNIILQIKYCVYSEQHHEQ